MTERQRNYLFLEQGIGAGVVNFVINYAIAWLMFRGMSVIPLWGQQSVAGDTIGTTFFLPFLSTLIVTRLAQGQVRAGHVPALNWTRETAPVLRWLPQGTLSRGLVLGALGIVAVGIPTAIVLGAAGVTQMTLSGFLWFKGIFSALLGVLVTPVIALFAIADGGELVQEGVKQTPA